MSTTSTNKQPLLIDRVFHEVYEMGSPTILTEKVTGTNFAQLLLNCTSNDGAIIEDIYIISQGQGTRNQTDESGNSVLDVDGNAVIESYDYPVNLYLTTDYDFLRANAVFVGQLVSASTKNEWVHSSNMPNILAPVPQVDGYQSNTPSQFRAFYVPKGKALWAARQTDNLSDNISNAPILGVSGGYY